MRLSTLWKVDREITDDGRNPIAEELVKQWPFDPASARFFRSSANFVYTVGADRRHFLRFADADERSRAAIEAELRLVTALAQAGIPVAVPAPSRAGKLVETVTTKWGTFHACVFPALTGQQLEFDDLDSPRFQSWGVALGRLHAATNTRQGASSSGRPSWKERLLSLDEHLDDGDGPVRREHDRVLSALEKLPVTRGNYGVVHGDFELDNLFWNGGISGIVDFDDCSHDWYAADIAYALRDLFVEGLNPGDARLKAFLSGYRRHFELDEQSFAELPTFIRAVELLQYMRVARSLDLGDDRDHPEWLRQLARKLEGRMAGYLASLAHG